jgi:hypothetical protein
MQEHVIQSGAMEPNIGQRDVRVSEPLQNQPEYFGPLSDSRRQLEIVGIDSNLSRGKWGQDRLGWRKILCVGQHCLDPLAADLDLQLV